VPAARHHGRLDALAPGTGYSLDVEDRDRHWDIVAEPRECGVVVWLSMPLTTTYRRTEIVPNLSFRARNTIYSAAVMAYVLTSISRTRYRRR
jgi:hypothetical protein